MKKSFTSRGFTYKVVYDLNFCDAYWNRPDLPDELLLSYLRDYMSNRSCEFINHNGEFWFFIDSECKYDELYAITDSSVRSVVTDETPAQINQWVIDVTNNLWELNQIKPTYDDL